MNSRRLQIKIASDRTIPLLTVVSVLGVAGILWQHNHEGYPPGGCNRPARIHWHLRCDGRGVAPGALAFLDSQKINLNQARDVDLMQIPRLSKRVAEAIVEKRMKLGGFSNFDQVDDVKGVGGKTLDRLKKFVFIVE